MHSETLSDLTGDLRALGGGRVWSLMVSLFGDLAQGEGDVIKGPVLSAIMRALDIKPEAARVALHRLRKDGWITSHKVGRNSHHSLTALGRSESVAASPRIYSAPDDLPGGWQLILLEAAACEPGSPDFVQIMPRLFVGPAGAKTPAGAVALPGLAAPAWLRAEVAANGQMKEYSVLHAALARLSQALVHPVSLSPLETAALRCLIVHNWRRLVLKHPSIPRPLTDRDGPAHKCHVIVADLLARFPRPALQDIAQDLASH